MKVIDLLNKIANGEEVPEKIKVGDDIYYRKIDANYGYVIDYLDIRDNSLFDFTTDYKYCFIKICLEWEIKDLEEDKKIAKIGKLNQASDNKQHLNNYILRNKINEIIDRLNGENNE